MKISGFIWFDEIIEKIETKHYTTLSEVEEIFAGKPKFKKMKKENFAAKTFTECLDKPLPVAI